MKVADLVKDKGFPGGIRDKEPTHQCRRQVWSMGGGDPLEDMAAHSNIFSWRIPWTEELADYSPWGRKESNKTEWLSTA